MPVPLLLPLTQVTQMALPSEPDQGAGARVLFAFGIWGFWFLAAIALVALLIFAPRLFGHMKRRKADGRYPSLRESH